MKPVHVNPHHVKKSKELDDNNPNKNDRKDPKTIAALVNEGRFSYPYIPTGIYAEIRNLSNLRFQTQEELCLCGEELCYLERDGIKTVSPAHFLRPQYTERDGTFNVYDDLKKKLMAKGVPEAEIAFIHDVNTEVKKTELFSKVKSGQVRFLLGSTAKMGAGTNVQERLIALHHLDVGWKPSDLEQREGRIIRQGNRNKKVHIYRYVTEGTFDSYMWQLIESKQKFISQIMTSKSPVRSCEDVDDTALSYAEVKALATGNPAIKEKMALDVEVSKLKLLKANFVSNHYRLEDDIAKNFPQQIAVLRESIEGYKADLEQYQGFSIRLKFDS